MVRRLAAASFVFVTVLSACAASSADPRSPDTSLGVYGRVTDDQTNAAVQDVCVTIGPPGQGGFCFARTDRAGDYAIDMADPYQMSPGGLYEIYFSREGYVTDHSLKQAIGSVVRVDFAMRHD